MIDIVRCRHVRASLLARLQVIGFIEAYRSVRKEESGAIAETVCAIGRNDQERGDVR